MFYDGDRFPGFPATNSFNAALPMLLLGSAIVLGIKAIVKTRQEFLFHCTSYAFTKLFAVGCEVRCGGDV